MSVKGIAYGAPHPRFDACTPSFGIHAHDSPFGLLQYELVAMAIDVQLSDSQRATEDSRFDALGSDRGKIFDSIDVNLKAWIEEQPLWFVATAPLGADGHVNISPRGHDSFSIVDLHRVAWVDFTGSGVETIAHIRENARVRLMLNIVR